MSTQLDRRLIGEICTLKHKNEIWIGQIVQIDDEHFAVKLLEAQLQSRFIGQQLLWVTIETLNHEIHLLDAEIVSDCLRDNERILTLTPISDITFQSKRQDPRLPVASSIELSYRKFPPRYNSWIKGDFLNISLGGAQFSGEMYIPKGELLEIKLGSPFFRDEEIVISRNVHSISENGYYIFSVQFLNLHESHQYQLEKYIENMLLDLREYKSVH